MRLYPAHQFLTVGNTNADALVPTVALGLCCFEMAVQIHTAGELPARRYRDLRTV